MNVEQTAAKKIQDDGHLEVVLKDCKLKASTERLSTRQFFLLFQMEEQDGLENGKMQKLRTDVQLLMPYTEEIKFSKNIFKFANVNPYEKIVIRVACFQVPSSITGDNSVQELMERNAQQLIHQAYKNPEQD